VRVPNRVYQQPQQGADAMERCVFLGFGDMGVVRDTYEQVEDGSDIDHWRFRLEDFWLGMVSEEFS